jgi:hypothetical protein
MAGATAPAVFFGATRAWDQFSSQATLKPRLAPHRAENGSLAMKRIPSFPLGTWD